MQGTKLNPVAPEFTPRSAVMVPSPHLAAENVASPMIAPRPRHIQWTDSSSSHHQQSSTGRRERSSATTGSVEVGSWADEVEKSDKEMKNTSIGEASVVPVLEKPAEAEKKAVEIRHPRYDRRIQSKSDPSTAPSGDEDNADGADGGEEDVDESVSWACTGHVAG